jgi:hypothetical protein
MKQKIILIFLILLATSVVAFEQYVTPFETEQRLGVERVTHYDYRVIRSLGKIDTIVYLEPAETDLLGKGVGRGGYSPIYPRGTAMVRSVISYGYPTAQVTIKTKDIPPSFENNMVYEGWLVDEDTGYRLSLGTFMAKFGGVGLLVYNINHYFDPYDLVEVTAEPFYDPDPMPGPTVLIGPIFKSSYYIPPPKESKMVTSVFT